MLSEDGSGLCDVDDGSSTERESVRTSVDCDMARCDSLTVDVQRDVLVFSTHDQ